ncbi:MAG TPA: oligosaccharide flippase family protein, partial [bacterium]|nr:oligosaccharide flippase family protein [bacterium]
MSISRRVAKNTAYVFLANAAGHLVVFLAGVVIARRLSVGEFGVLAFARSFPQLFIVVADLGIEYLVVREVAVRRETAAEYVGRLIPFKLALTAT